MILLNMNVLELKGNLRIVLRKAFNVILLDHYMIGH